MPFSRSAHIVAVRLVLTRGEIDIAVTRKFTNLEVTSPFLFCVLEVQFNWPTEKVIFGINKPKHKGNFPRLKKNH